MTADPRPPVLYLRSFRDDGTALVDVARGRFAHWWSELLAAATPEEETAAALDAIGPVVAIGKPGEPLPEIGAARLYVDHDAWQAEVRSLMDRAALVVLRIGALVCFPGGSACVIPVRRTHEAAPGASWWRTSIDFGSRAGRPLRSAWQDVIRRLGLDVRDDPSRSRAMSIVLALLAGLLGAHWFYLGNYRRGAVYLLLAPLAGLSLFLGWYDALRFIWVDRAEFERRFAPPVPR